MNPNNDDAHTETPAEAAASADTVDGAMFLDNCPGIDCPRCPGTLKIATIDRHKIAGCSDCHGLLVQTRLLQSIIQQRRANHQGPEARPRMIDEQQLRRGCECPACGFEMDTHPYSGGPGNVVIDSCIRCHLVWLDCAELKQLVEAQGTRESAASGAPGFDADSIEFPDWRDKTAADEPCQVEFLAAMLSLF